jgi:site-specific DNA-methyltransferase (adenine-specific)
MKSEIFNEDCMAVMARYPDKYFDLAVVDPPYGIDKDLYRTNGNKFQNKLYNKKRFDKSGKPNIEYFNELFRVSKNQIIWGGNYFANNLPETANWIVWDKGVEPNVSFRKFEIAWTNIECNIIRIKHTGFIHADGRGHQNIHPTQKPIKLYDYIFNQYAKPNDLILDTHLGSGSSRIAAHKAGLSFIGCELDKEYFEAQEKRFKQFTAQLTLF